MGKFSEPRPQQRNYAATATYAFEPRQRKSENNILLAEAGTGLGKTLGYLAPAWLWARKNNAPVWISTYTKNLQRQLDQETARLVGDPEERRTRIVIRKGRENYLCLLNMQETFGRLERLQSARRVARRTDCALGTIYPRRRHGGRRFSLVAPVAVLRCDN